MASLTRINETGQNRYRIFGQPKFSGERLPASPIGYELFIREFDGHQWIVPTNLSNIGLSTIYRLVSAVLPTVDSSAQILSINLEEPQFIDPAYQYLADMLQRQTPIRLFTELTERRYPDVSTPQLVEAAREFHNAGLNVCVDDIGIEANNLNLVTAISPYVDEYKFAFQDYYPDYSFAAAEPKFSAWYKLARQQHKILAVEGIETSRQLMEIEAKYPCDVVQGYLFGKPEPMLQSVNDEAVSGE